jgi:hypothetical protein
MLVAPAPLTWRHGCGPTVDFGEQLKRFENPLALIADLVTVPILVGNVNAEALG